jgi:hypothetical protein
MLFFKFLAALSAALLRVAPAASAVLVREGGPVPRESTLPPLYILNDPNLTYIHGGTLLVFSSPILNVKNDTSVSPIFVLVFTLHSTCF